MTGESLFFHQDRLMSTLALTDNQGVVKESYTYDPYGNLLTSQVSPSTNLLYTGRELDSETGLYYNRARFYDPQLGRFISTDPKGYAAGLNLYTYTRNNPLTFRDPEGLDVSWGGCGGFGGFLSSVGGFFSSAASYASSVFSSAASGVAYAASIAAQYASAAASAVASAASAVASAVTSVASSVASAVSSAASAVGSEVSQAASAVGSVAKSIGSAIASGLSRLASGAVSLAKAVAHYCGGHRGYVDSYCKCQRPPVPSQDPRKLKSRFLVNFLARFCIFSRSPSPRC